MKEVATTANKCYRLIQNYIRVRKCYNDDYRKEDGSVLLYRTDRDKDLTTTAVIIDVGPKCVLVDKSDIGNYVLCPEISNDMKRLVNEDFVIRETAIVPCIIEWEKE